ncbi:MAG: dihydroorotate dehydrogenase, partial [Syntrophomonadaceae bacterium]|nr:dihydroorotate dehydrogenase [Syntrophomonadaceae bacterium]
MGGADLSVKMGAVTFKNPVMAASGTFGYGREYDAYFDISRLGAVISKGTTLNPRPGNPAPRIAECSSGMLNAIGLENPGVEAFVNEHLPWLRDKNAVVVINIAGSSIDE